MAERGTGYSAHDESRYAEALLGLRSATPRAPRLPGVNALESGATSTAAIIGPPQHSTSQAQRGSPPKRARSHVCVQDGGAATTPVPSAENEGRQQCLRYVQHGGQASNLRHHLQHVHPAASALASISAWAPAPTTGLPSIHPIPSITYAPRMQSQHEVPWPSSSGYPVHSCDPSTHVPLHRERPQPLSAQASTDPVLSEVSLPRTQIPPLQPTPSHYQAHPSLSQQHMHASTQEAIMVSGTGGNSSRDLLHDSPQRDSHSVQPQIPVWVGHHLPESSFAYLPPVVAPLHPGVQHHHLSSGPSHYHHQPDASGPARQHTHAHHIQHPPRSSVRLATEHSAIHAAAHVGLSQEPVVGNRDHQSQVMVSQDKSSRDRAFETHSQIDRREIGLPPPIPFAREALPNIPGTRFAVDEVDVAAHERMESTVERSRVEAVSTGQHYGLQDKPVQASYPIAQTHGKQVPASARARVDQLCPAESLGSHDADHPGNVLHASSRGAVSSATVQSGLSAVAQAAASLASLVPHKSVSLRNDQAENVPLAALAEVALNSPPPVSIVGRKFGSTELAEGPEKPTSVQNGVSFDSTNGGIHETLYGPDSGRANLNVQADKASTQTEPSIDVSRVWAQDENSRTVTGGDHEGRDDSTLVGMSVGGRQSVPAARDADVVEKTLKPVPPKVDSQIEFSGTKKDAQPLEKNSIAKVGLSESVLAAAAPKERSEKMRQAVDPYHDRAESQRNVRAHTKLAVVKVELANDEIKNSTAGKTGAQTMPHLTGLHSVPRSDASRPSSGGRNVDALSTSHGDEDVKKPFEEYKCVRIDPAPKQDVLMKEPARRESSRKEVTKKESRREKQSKGKRAKNQGRFDGNANQGEEITRCPCGSMRNSTFMIACDSCNTWQHCKCMGIRKNEEAPTQYFCHLCRPNEVRMNCIAHPRYKEKMASGRERERNKSCDPSLAAVKPAELRRLFHLDLKERRNQSESVTDEELFRRYATVYENQLVQDRHSVVEGLHVLTSLSRREVQIRLEKTMRGDGLKHENPEHRVATRNPGASSEDPGGDGGIDTKGQPRNVPVPLDMASGEHDSSRKQLDATNVPSEGAMGFDDGRSRRGVGKSTGKRARPASLNIDEYPAEGVSLSADGEAGSDLGNGRNMSREERKMFQIMRMFKKLEEKEERGKKKPRTSIPSDSPRSARIGSPVDRSQVGNQSANSESRLGQWALTDSAPAEPQRSSPVLSGEVNAGGLGAKHEDKEQEASKSLGASLGMCQTLKPENEFIGSDAGATEKAKDRVRERAKERERLQPQGGGGSALRARRRRDVSPHGTVGVPHSSSRNKPGRSAIVAVVRGVNVARVDHQERTGEQLSSDRPPLDPSLGLGIRLPGPYVISSHLIPESRRSLIEGEAWGHHQETLEIEMQSKKMIMKSRFCPNSQFVASEAGSSLFSRSAEFPSKKRWLCTSTMRLTDNPEDVCATETPFFAKQGALAIEESDAGEAGLSERNQNSVHSAGVPKIDSSASQEQSAFGGALSESEVVKAKSKTSTEMVSEDLVELKPAISAEFDVDVRRVVAESRSGSASFGVKKRPRFVLGGNEVESSLLTASIVIKPWRKTADLPSTTSTSGKDQAVVPVLGLRSVPMKTPPVQGLHGKRGPEVGTNVSRQTSLAGTDGPGQTKLNPVIDRNSANMGPASILKSRAVSQKCASSVFKPRPNANASAKMAHFDETAPTAPVHSKQSQPARSEKAGEPSKPVLSLTSVEPSKATKVVEGKGARGSRFIRKPTPPDSQGSLARIPRASDSVGPEAVPPASKRTPRPESSRRVDGLGTNAPVPLRSVQNADPKSRRTNKRYPVVSSTTSGPSDVLRSRLRDFIGDQAGKTEDASVGVSTVKATETPSNSLRPPDGGSHLPGVLFSGSSGHRRSSGRTTGPVAPSQIHQGQHILHSAHGVGSSSPVPGSQWRGPSFRFGGSAPSPGSPVGNGSLKTGSSSGGYEHRYAGRGSGMRMNGGPKHMPNGIVRNSFPPSPGQGYSSRRGLGSHPPHRWKGGSGEYTSGSFVDAGGGSGTGVRFVPPKGGSTHVVGSHTGGHVAGPGESGPKRSASTGNMSLNCGVGGSGSNGGGSSGPNTNNGPFGGSTSPSGSSGQGGRNSSAATAAWSSFRQRNGWAQGPGSESESGAGSRRRRSNDMYH